MHIAGFELKYRIETPEVCGEKGIRNEERRARAIIACESHPQPFHKIRLLLVYEVEI